MRHYTLRELESLPTLATGQADDLKIDTGTTRIWLSRCSIEDGEPYNHKVSVEEYSERLRRWIDVEEYPALEDDDDFEEEDENKQEGEEQE